MKDAEHATQQDSQAGQHGPFTPPSTALAPSPSPPAQLVVRIRVTRSWQDQAGGHLHGVMRLEDVHGQPAYSVWLQDAPGPITANDFEVSISNSMRASVWLHDVKLRSSHYWPVSQSLAQGNSKKWVSKSSWLLFPTWNAFVQ
jgi:hypothetical protein